MTKAVSDNAEAVTGPVMKGILFIEKKFKIKTVVDRRILEECFERVQLTLNDFKPVAECSPEKKAATLCFWIRKLKPFRVKDEFVSHRLARLINEIVAFQTAYFYLWGANAESGKEGPSINHRFFHDLMEALRYHSYSPHALVQVFEALAIK